MTTKIQPSKDSEIIVKSIQANSNRFSYTGFIAVIAIVFIIIGGFAMSVLLLFFGLLLLGVFMASTFYVYSVSIDKKANVVHVYKNHWLYKTGNSYPLYNYSAIQLFYQLDKIKPGGSVGGVSTTWGPTQYKVYEICLVAENTPKLILNTFDEAAPAYDFQKIVAQKTGITHIKKAERMFEK